MVNIKIEGVSYQVEEGLTILEAAKKCGYEIPSLCAFNHGECNHGSCRVCLVEVVGAMQEIPRRPSQRCRIRASIPKVLLIPFLFLKAISFSR